MINAYNARYYSFKRTVAAGLIVLALVVAVLAQRSGKPPSETSVLPSRETPVSGVVAAPVVATPESQVLAAVRPPQAGQPTTLEGKAPPGATVQVYEGDNLLGEVQAGPDGTWQLELPDLAPGPHKVRIVALGRQGPIVSALSINVEPFMVRPTIRAPERTVLAEGETLTLEGTAAPGVKVQVYEDDALLASAQANPDGTWQVEITDLTVGTHNLSVVAVDDQGRTSPSSAPLTVTCLALADLVPTVNLPSVAQRFEGVPITVSGTGPAGWIVRVFDRGTEMASAVVKPDGTWTATLNPLPEGPHSLTARAENETGLQTPLSVAVDFEVKPAVAVVPRVLMDRVVFPAGEPVTVQGIGFPYTRIELITSKGAVGETATDAKGTWSVPLELPPGEYRLSAVARDALGRRSAPSEPITLVIQPASAVVQESLPMPVSMPPSGASLKDLALDRLKGFWGHFLGNIPR